MFRVQWNLYSYTVIILLAISLLFFLLFVTQLRKYRNLKKSKRVSSPEKTVAADEVKLSLERTAELLSEVGKLKSDLNSYQETYKSKLVKSIADLRESYESQVEDLKKVHARALKDLNLRHEHLKNKSKKELSDLQKSYQLLFSNLEDEFKKSKESRSNQVEKEPCEKLEIDHFKLSEKFEREKGEIVSKYESELAKLKEQLLTMKTSTHLEVDEIVEKSEIEKEHLKAEVKSQAIEIDDLKKQLMIISTRA